jgi:hypothetical protein
VRVDIHKKVYTGYTKLKVYTRYTKLKVYTRYTNLQKASTANTGSNVKD